MKSRLLGAMRTCILALSVPLAVLVVSISNAYASVTFKFEGVLTHVDTQLSEAFSTGDKFTGTYTFDESSFDPYAEDFGFAHFENSISAMSFATNNYKASAANGDIYHDFEDEAYYFINISPLSGDSIDNYALNNMHLSWVADSGVAPGNSTVTTPLAHPLFNPDLPAWVQDFNSDFFDADGNLVYDGMSGRTDLELPDPNQPLFYKDGSPVPTNGFFSLDFSNGQLVAGMYGNLSSVTVVHTPIPTAVWLFGSGLLGLIGIAKRKQISLRQL